MFRENIGENLRNLRKQYAGLSVAKVVDKINESGYEVSADTYYKWERGTRKPPCEAVPYIAQALGTTEGMIFHLHERQEELAFLEKKGMSEKSKRFPPEIADILQNVRGRIDVDVCFIFFLAGMGAALDNEDRSFVTTLLSHLYESGQGSNQ